MQNLETAVELLGPLRPQTLKIPQVFQKDVADLLAFIDRRLEPGMVALLPRGDYKEFLELAKVFLGGSIDRKKGYT